ncbi:MAG TPA: TonB-dependent receptor [Flavipsychrobacter sp.]|nr:TonB-dependent receptor [Flavipsychrobacter sp.]
MFLKRLSLTCVIILFSCNVFSQTYRVTGQILDSKDNSSLIGVTVFLSPANDSTQKNGTTTDANGNFEIDNVATGRYYLKSVYLGYQTHTQIVTVAGKNTGVGAITMKVVTNKLKDVVVEGKQIRAQQMGDTTQFNADAYKTNPDATAEDLVTKMPGVTSDNTGVKVNGESVQQVYVDGKPFFGTDPTLALKNLPAEVIDKIQVFDKLSDQAQFTGFDDGNSQKTLNIVTKKNKSNGQFGKAFAGYGTDDRYLAGGSLNDFDSDTRISIIALSNNVNQQNFSVQDILGVVGSNSGQNIGGFSGRGGRGGGGGSTASVNNFLVGQQGGITTTNSIGLNYSDNWGKKIKVSGSYFFNSTDNTNNTQLVRNYFTSSDSALVYNENNNSEAKNFNHRFNFRFEYDIDSFNALIITPSISIQQNYTTTGLLANDSLDHLLSSNTVNNSTANYSGYNFSNNILFQHKFHKRGRTISVNVGTSSNDKIGDGSYYSLNKYYQNDTPDDSTLLNQQYTLYNDGYTLSTNVTYTEPISKKSQLMANYNPSYTKSDADKESYNYDSAVQQYSDFDALLSNKYKNTYITQRGGLSFRNGDRKFNLMFGANLQYATLQGEEYFPYSYSVDKVFTDVLPIGMLNWRFADGRNLRIMYRTNTVAPSITQLQNVIDISNPLLLKTGNINLRQDYEQTLIIRYGLTKAAKAHNFFIFFYANYINDYIGNSTFIPTRDTLFQNYLIRSGSQLTFPVNLNGYWNNKAFVTYSLPADFIKSNLNLNGGVAYTRSPTLVNNTLNISNNYVPTGGVVLSSNVSEKLDFTLSYTGTYNIVQNTLQNQANNNYYTHTAAFKINWIFWKGVVINTNFTDSYYSGFSNAPSENIFLWNAYIGYKFLKGRAVEARISAFDILNQNKSITRSVTETYVENDRTQVLQRYFMLQLTYTLRNFKGAAPDSTNEENMYKRYNNFRNYRNNGGQY